jgi:hypothetical protein
MTLEEAVSTLKHHESFGVFIGSIHQMREEAIADMNKAPLEQVQQLSGKILAYDDILQMSNHEEVRRRFNT